MHGGVLFPPGFLLRLPLRLPLLFVHTRAAVARTPRLLLRAARVTSPALLAFCAASILPCARENWAEMSIHASFTLAPCFGYVRRRYATEVLRENPTLPFPDITGRSICDARVLFKSLQKDINLYTTRDTSAASRGINPCVVHASAMLQLCPTQIRFGSLAREPNVTISWHC